MSIKLDIDNLRDYGVEFDHIIERAIVLRDDTLLLLTSDTELLDLRLIFNVYEKEERSFVKYEFEYIDSETDLPNDFETDAFIEMDTRIIYIEQDLDDLILHFKDGSLIKIHVVEIDGHLNCWYNYVPN